MKYWFQRVAPVLLVLAFACSTALAQTRIVTIDLRKVFDGYWKTKQADAGLKDRAADMEKEHKNMLEDYRKAREDYQALVASINDQAVSQEERDRRKKSAEEKLKYLKDQEDTITQYERQARNTLDEQRRRMRDSLLGDIRNIINGKAKAANASLVIDTAAESFNNTPVILFTNNENDITDSVLQQLNAAAPADAKTDDKMAPVSGKNATEKSDKKGNDKK